MEEVHSKIKNYQNHEDLETSLTLAAEAGNALLIENTKIKQDLYDMTQRITQLEQLPIVNHENFIEQMKMEAKIEDLERENEAALHRNSALVETLNEVEQQLLKEKQLRSELINTFEELDREKELIMHRLEKEIKLLKEENKRLSKKESNVQANDLKPTRDSEAQTNTYEIPAKNPSLPHSLELMELKIRQEHIELTTKAMQDQLQKQQDLQTQATLLVQTQNVSTRNPLHSRPHDRSNNRKRTKGNRGNHFSVSLQIKKNKEHTENIKICAEMEKYKENVSTTLETTYKISPKSPPITAKKLEENETYEDFFKKNIIHYQQISENYNNICKSTQSKENEGSKINNIIQDEETPQTHFLGIPQMQELEKPHRTRIIINSRLKLRH